LSKVVKTTSQFSMSGIFDVLSLFKADVQFQLNLSTKGRERLSLKVEDQFHKVFVLLSTEKSFYELVNGFRITRYLYKYILNDVSVGL
jgi:hypothetical protein